MSNGSGIWMICGYVILVSIARGKMPLMSPSAGSEDLIMCMKRVRRIRFLLGVVDTSYTSWVITVIVWMRQQVCRLRDRYVLGHE